jgi:hypothetical protein
MWYHLLATKGKANALLCIRGCGGTADAPVSAFDTLVTKAIES